MPINCVPSFKKISVLFNYMCECVHVYVSETLMEARGIGFPGARVIGLCELPNMQAVNQTQVIWKNRKCS